LPYRHYKYSEQVQIDHVSSIKDITAGFIKERLKNIGYAFIRGGNVMDSTKFQSLQPVMFPINVYDYHEHGGIYNATRKDQSRVYEFTNVKTSFWNMAVHHDLSYRTVMPSKGAIAHFQKAEVGGCTPLYDNRAMWFEMMDNYHDLMIELLQYGIIYYKTLPDEKDKEKVELWREADIASWQQIILI